MKNMKKIVCALMALVMVLTMGLSAFAAGTQTVTINGHTSGHTYEAYQIFDGDYHEGVLSTPVWGTGVADGDALLAALKADTTDIGGQNFAALFAAAVDVSDVVTVLSQFSTDGKLLDHFAQVVKPYLNTTPDSTATSATTEYVISNLDAGYYLIRDVAGSQENKHDYYTKYILTLVGTDNSKNIVTVKGDVPKIEKKVSQSGQDGTYGDTVDQMVGQDVHYIIGGTLPSNYLDYTYYDYVITDKLSKGLTYNNDASIWIQHPDNSRTQITSDAIKKPIINVTGGGGADTIITFTWSQATNNDLRSKNIAIVPGDRIVVTYSAKVNEGAIIGNPGNPNEVKLNFSNEPNNGGRGETPPSIPVVYVFKMDVFKTDTINNTLKLEGAEFVLYHQHVIGSDKKNEYAILSGSTPNYTLTGWTEDIDAATKLVSDANGEFTVKGIRGGLTYYLKETKAPAGYHLMDTDVAIILQPTYTGSTLTSLGYQVDGKEGTGDIPTGVVDVTVLNDKGNTLPSTGGMGTTLFYVVGGILFVGAAVVLITKKRMSSEN